MDQRKALVFVKLRPVIFSQRTACFYATPGLIVLRAASNMLRLHISYYSLNTWFDLLYGLNDTIFKHFSFSFNRGFWLVLGVFRCTW